jgi:hypothetical protein
LSEEVTQQEKRLVERMSYGWRAKLVEQALENGPLVRELFKLDKHEQEYLKDVLILDELGWKLTEAGPGSWEAVHKATDTPIEATHRSALVKMARING